MNLTGDLIGHWSALELLWMALAVLGVVFSSLNIREAWHNFHALGGALNGRRRISIGDIRRESFRILIYVSMILAGLVAGAQSATNRPMTAAGIAVTVALLLIEALQVSQSVLDRLDSNYLLVHGLQTRDESGRFKKDG